MKIALSPQTPAEVEAEALAIPISSGRGAPEVPGLAPEAAAVLADVVARNEHRGRLFEMLPVRLEGRPAKLLLYGLGAARDLDGQRLRWAHHELVRAARGYGYRRLALAKVWPLDDEALSGVVEGALLGTWDMRSRQTGQRDRTELEELSLLGFGLDREREVVAAQQLGEATNRTREWQNLPSNVLTPEAVAEEARRIGRRHDVEVEVLGVDELRAGGYNLILAVGQASANPPRLIRLHKPGPEGGATHLGLVGKGITFDSGGLSLKEAENMWKMKADMGGAAAVLSAFDAIAARKPAIAVTAVLACAENLISGTSTRPGDVVTAAGGKTVEIVNTDAEGRLVLADALTYAIRHGATQLVDVATLTGAAHTALGNGGTLAVASDDSLWAQVWEAAERAGERVWRMPIYADYRVLIQSRYADLKNAYYGQAGAVTAGMFIQEFTEGRPWVHLDIAASAWNDKGDLTTIPRGPTGVATRTFVHLAELLADAAR